MLNSSLAAAATGGSVLNVAALLASGTQVTPQIAMAAQMAALQAKALAETGIAVPSYYNPAAVNPMKFAEQEKKRKMLWQGKKEGVSFLIPLFCHLFLISSCLGKQIWIGKDWVYFSSENLIVIFFNLPHKLMLENHNLRKPVLMQSKTVFPYVYKGERCFLT